jgi:microfibrillar-associated protein 1
MMSTVAARKQVPRPARPAARYWKGKAPKGVADAESDSDDVEDTLPQEEDGDVPISGEQDLVEEPIHMGTGKSMNVSLKNVRISGDGKVIVAGREESGRTVVEADGLSLLYHSNSCF